MKLFDMAVVVIYTFALQVVALVAAAVKMALNQFMHPRNRYRDIRPDFKMLAEKYAEFREHTTTDLKGKV